MNNCRMKKIEIIKSFYEPKIGSALPDFEILGWESAEAQKYRFDAFIKNINLEGLSILDVGCGLGNLLEHLTEENISVKYTGVDILPGMIAHALQDVLGAFIRH